MTLAAAFHMNGNPVVLGDLLMSGSADGQPSTLKLPAAGPNQSLLNHDRTLEAKYLRQKIVIVSPNCAFAVAGTAGDVVECIKELRTMTKRPLTRDGVQKYLHGLEVHGLNPDAELVGYVAEGDQLALLGARCERLSAFSPDSRDMFVAGSGASKMQQLLPSLQTEVRQLIAGKGDGPQAIMRAAQIGALFLDVEWDGGGTLADSFGGGYEVAYYDGHQFAKLRDITYCLWDASYNEREDHLRFGLRLVMKQHYAGDILMVRSLRCEASPKDERKIESIDSQFQYIFPIDGNNAARALPGREEMPAGSPVSAHCIRVPGTSTLEFKQRTFLIAMTGDREPAITLEESRTNGTLIKVSGEFFARLKNELRKK